jgi:hypothetical protein
MVGWTGEAEPSEAASPVSGVHLQVFASGQYILVSLLLYYGNNEVILLYYLYYNNY